MNSPGKLYIVSTPIGNLEDISSRTARILGEVDFIAAEDTRVTAKILNHLGLKKSLISCQKYNEKERSSQIVSRILTGENAAFCSDAGTPVISDPGGTLVSKALDEGVTVIPIPGPSAVVTALSVCGLRCERFCFEGFLPSQDDKKARKRILEDLKDESRTIIVYEAPHHLRAALDDLYENLGDRRISICRELTKKFEDVNPTTIERAISFYKYNEPRGEYVLVIEGKSLEEQDEEKRKSWQDMSVEDHMKFYEDQGIPRKEAMKMVAADRGVGKREIYKELLGE